FGGSLTAHGEWARGILETRHDPLAAEVDRLPAEFAAVGAVDAAAAMRDALNGTYTTSTELLIALSEAIGSTRDSWAPRVPAARRREIDKLRRALRARFR